MCLGVIIVRGTVPSSGRHDKYYLLTVTKKAACKLEGSINHHGSQGMLQVDRLLLENLWEVDIADGMRKLWALHPKWTRHCIMVWYHTYDTHTFGPMFQSFLTSTGPDLSLTASKNSIVHTLTLCTKEPRNHPAQQSKSSLWQTSSGNNWNPQHTALSTATRTLNHHQDLHNSTTWTRRFQRF